MQHHNKSNLFIDWLSSRKEHHGGEKTRQIFQSIMWHSRAVGHVDKNRVFLFESPLFFFCGNENTFMRHKHHAVLTYDEMQKANIKETASKGEGFCYCDRLNDKYWLCVKCETSSAFSS